MNIFVLDKDPILAAQQQCDKHVVKMIVESAQMLSTTHRMLDGKLEKRKSVSGKRLVPYWSLHEYDLNKELTMYKAVHMNHPCTVWTRESEENYIWHYNHFCALCDEYQHRYGKVHLTDSLLRDMLKNPPKNIKRGFGPTPFPLAMGSNPECMDYSNPVQSYRKFYQTKSKRFDMKWSKRKTPNWFNYA